MLKETEYKLIMCLAEAVNKGKTVCDDRNVVSLARTCGVAGVVSDEYRMGNIRKNMLFSSERKELFDFLEDIGCWYVPMKGLVIDSFYPDSGMRQMSDNDILFDPAFRDQVCQWFFSREYDTDWANGVGPHDTYTKEPVFNFEMHCQFFRSQDEILHDFFRNIGDRLIEVDGFERKLSAEDFYLYLIAHSYKHYSASGDGLRLLTDVYVYLRECADDMDWDYVRDGLACMELTEFEEQVRKLAERCLCTREDGDELRLTADEEEMLTFIIESDSRGREDRRIDVGVKRLGKMRYLKERLWPSAEFFVNEDSDCREKPWKVNYYRVKRLKDRIGKTDGVWKEVAKVIKGKRG